MYTSGPTVVVEELLPNKPQTFLTVGHDELSGLEISPNKQFLLSWSQKGEIDGTPMIYVWTIDNIVKRPDQNLKCQISINHGELRKVTFTHTSNMVLALSVDQEGNSVVGFWDIMEQECECLC